MQRNNYQLKQLFKKETQDLCVRMIFVTALIGVIFYPLFGILDYFAFPDIYLNMWKLRLIIVFIAIILLFLRNSSFVRNNSANIAAFIMLASGLIIAKMCHLTGGTTSLYYAGINLTILIMIFVLPLDVPRVLVVCTMIYAYYMAAGIPSEPGFKSVIVSNNFFLLTTMILAILGTYFKNVLRLNELKARLSLDQANKELSKLDELKSQFFSNISHEIRTPLTSITAPLEKFNSSIDSNTRTFTGDERTLMQMTLNANKLLKLINDLLDFSKLESGMMELKCRRLDIVKMLEELKESVMPNADKKKQSIEIKVERFTPATAGTVHRVNGSLGQPPQTFGDDKQGGVLGDDDRDDGGENTGANGGDSPRSGTVPLTSPSGALEMYLDSGKIDKVFINLLSNAIKFTPDEGKITVTITELEDKVRVSVADTGIGIPEEELPRLFERFHQVDGSSTRSFGGTGIGLNMAKELVLLHNGTITVESKKEVGSIFTVELLKGAGHLTQKQIQEDLEVDRRQADRRSDDRRQLDIRKLQMADVQADQTIKAKLLEEIETDRRQKAERRKKAKEETLSGAYGGDTYNGENTGVNTGANTWDSPHSGTVPLTAPLAVPLIQIIDDDPSIAGLIRNALKEDYEVQVAFDGQEGYEMILKNIPDIIITDLMMPNMNGYELTSIVKQGPDTKHIPVIMLTAKDELKSKIQGLEQGADDYLAKPFNEEELKARVKSLLNLRKLENELAKTNRSLEESYKKLKNAETTLMHTEKIRALGIMMMGLAHELNNPLAFIDGGASNLRMLLAKENIVKNPENVEKMLKAVEDGVVRCFDVMKRLREFARSDRVFYEEYDIRKGINSALETIRQLSEGKINVQTDFKTDVQAECVSSFINQVLLNVINNSMQAIQAVREAGTIIVRTAEKDDNYIIEVEDDGIGIKKENLQKLFDPFFTTKDPNKGMGLGLSICYKIISDHGGKIEVESQENKRTIVRLILPVKQKKAQKV